MKRRMQKLSVLLLIVLATCIASATTIMQAGSRLYVSSGSGTFTDGVQVTVTGPTITASPSVVEFLGGAGGAIASGTPGVEFARTNWSKLDGVNLPWRFSTTRTLHRSRSLLFDAQAENDGRGTYFFNYGSGIVQEYYSANYYWEPGVGVTDMQWKIRRLTNATAVEVDDSGVVDHEDPSWRVTTMMPGGAFALSTVVYDQDTTHHNHADAGVHLFDGEPYAPVNVWMRYEHWWTSNSSPGAADGSIRVRITRLDNGTEVCDQTFTGIIYRGAGADDGAHQYASLQNYFGNGVGGPEHGNAKMYMDDILLQAKTSGVGAYVRGEILNNAVYATSTIHNPMPVTVVGTQWTFIPNGNGTHVALFDQANNMTIRPAP